MRRLGITVCAWTPLGFDPFTADGSVILSHSMTHARNCIIVHWTSQRDSNEGFLSSVSSGVTAVVKIQKNDIPK